MQFWMLTPIFILKIKPQQNKQSKIFDTVCFYLKLKAILEHDPKQILELNNDHHDLQYHGQDL